MLSELASGSKVTGLKQTKRAVLDGSAVKVYIAEDAEMRLRRELVQIWSEHSVPVVDIVSMQVLGQACGIKIGASSAALLRQ